MEVSYIYRSRHVGQSYLSSVFTTIWAFFTVIPLVYRVRPKLVRHERLNGKLQTRLVCILDPRQWSWNLHTDRHRQFSVIGKCPRLHQDDMWIFSLQLLFLIERPKVIFVESICRVETLSLTGKILQYLPVHILVQWPQLTERYPKCQYIGRLVWMMIRIKLIFS